MIIYPLFIKIKYKTKIGYSEHKGLKTSNKQNYWPYTYKITVTFSKSIVIRKMFLQMN